MVAATSLPRAVGWETYQQCPTRRNARSLSVLCTLLMFACAVIALSVLWIGVLSTPLLGVGIQLATGAAAPCRALCVLFGVAIGLGAAWTSVLKTRDDAEASTLSQDGCCSCPETLVVFTIKNPEESVEILGRRTLIVATISMTAAATLYWNPIHRALKPPVTKVGRAIASASTSLASDKGDTTRIFRSEVPVFYQDKKGQFTMCLKAGLPRSLKTPATKLMACSTARLCPGSLECTCAFCARLS